MTEPKISAWRLSLAVPSQTVALFETALESLGGVLTLDADDGQPERSFQIYLEDQPEELPLADLLVLAAKAGGIETPSYALEALPEQDWVAESQRALPAILAGGFYLHGSHISEPAPKGTTPILIDAGAAFGTGRHETTRGCLIALSKLAEGLAIARPLDLGCGSGVLAIAIAKLWPVRVWAADNDPEAVKVARENAGLNGVGAALEVVQSDGFQIFTERSAEPFDLIVANILAEPLIALADDLVAHLAAGGHVLLSGLLIEQAEAVCDRYRSAGLELVEQLEIDEWATLILRR